MNDNGIKVTFPKEFKGDVDKVVGDILKMSPIQTDLSIPGQVQMWYHIGGDLDQQVTAIRTALTPVVLEEFSVARF